MMARTDKYLIIGIRFACIGIFLYSSVSLTVQSVVAAVALFVSIFFVEPTKTALVIQTRVVDIAKWNPLRKKLDLVTEPQISQEAISTFHRLLEESLTYDATEVEAVRNFHSIQLQSQCAFAKNARIWGSADYQSHLSLEENIRRSIPTFMKFTCVCVDLCLDGFLFEFPGATYGQSIKDLGEAVHQLLKVLSESDPSMRHCMADGNIEDSGWVFEFNRISFFITSFASCYPSSNSRFSFGAEHSYVLFQPEVSFARHDLPLNTSETSWNKPRTVRDRIRVAFRDAGRPYDVPDTVRYPMVWDMVKPLHQSDDLVRWWKTTSGDSEEEFTVLN